MNIRPTRANDIGALQHVLNETGLFPGEILPEMVKGFLDAPAPGDIWLTCEQDGVPIGFCYAVQEKLTDGTFNMLAIAVLPSAQNKGAGGALVRALEEMLRRQGHRVLIADTSGTEAFRKTRAFYESKGYTREAIIRDFWAAGDDKITYWKAL